MKTVIVNGWNKKDMCLVEEHESILLFLLFCYPDDSEVQKESLFCKHAFSFSLSLHFWDTHNLLLSFIFMLWKTVK